MIEMDDYNIGFQAGVLQGRGEGYSDALEESNVLHEKIDTASRAIDELDNLIKKLKIVINGVRA